MTRATAHLKGEVQERTPTAHGTLRASVFGEVDVFADGLGASGLVSSSLGYAPAVEHGTRPHHPPVTPLIDWARQKLALSGTEAREAAHRIAWKIAHKGTEGAHMFETTFNTNTAQVSRDFTETVARIIRRIGGRS